MGYREHRTAINLLGSILILAIYTTWVMSERNGYIATLRHLRDYGPHLLPGSSNPLLQTYTKLPPLDYVLTVLQCFFANVTDGSAPHLSLLTFYFMGQLIAVITGMAVESQRSFNKGKAVSWFITWGLAIQGLGFCTVVPIYAIIHLTTTSQSTSTPRYSFGTGLQSLPQSILLGFIIPSILTILPVSPVRHQQFVAAWQFFPLWISTAMFVNKLFSKPFTTTRQTHSQLLSAYHFGESIALWSHRLTFGLLATIYLLPTYFPTYLAESLKFRTVFIPPSPNSPVQVDLITGALNFLQYDMLTGFMAAITWQLSVAETRRHFDTIWDIVSKGPGFAFVRIAEIRDQSLFELEEKRAY